MIGFLIANVNGYALFTPFSQFIIEEKSHLDLKRVHRLIDNVLCFCKSAYHTFQVPIFIPQYILENREIGVIPIRAQRCNSDCLFFLFK